MNLEVNKVDPCDILIAQRNRPVSPNAMHLGIFPPENTPTTLEGCMKSCEPEKIFILIPVLENASKEVARSIHLSRAGLWRSKSGRNTRDKEEGYLRSKFFAHVSFSLEFWNSAAETWTFRNDKLTIKGELQCA
jgi:hypothetical protein